MTLSDGSLGEKVPVLRPRLPTREALMPYLERIDSSRTYSNWGPLTVELQRRLTAELGLQPKMAVTAASGTSALVGAILAVAGHASPERPFAAVPAYTFVGTAAAVRQCGYELELIDIEPGSWALEPDRMEGHPQLDRFGVVVPVAPYGRPVAQDRWAQFMARTGIPVAIDGAATFDRLCDGHEDAVGAIPVAMSFHATKCFATGEGGCVLATDAKLLMRVERALNFGFHETRESRGEAINGKMSEYHAAVGLAALDGWEAKRSALDKVFAKYREAFDGRGIGGHLFVPPRVGASYALLLCPDHPTATRVREGLDRNRVGNRLWYGTGLHRQPAFAQGGNGDLTATDDLAPRLLGLPLAPDLEDGAIERVAAIAADAISRR